MRDMLGDAVRVEREKRGWSQRQLALEAGVSRKHLSDLEAGANVSLKVIEKIAAALKLKEISLNEVKLLGGVASRQPNVSLIRDRATKLIRAASDILEEISGEKGRVLRFPASEVPSPRILFDEDQETINTLKQAITTSPHGAVEWRAAFRGKGSHKVPRAGKAAAGAGAEPPPIGLDEEDVLLREIPEHYWDRGARMVLRVVGDSLSGLGYVDRDLLFIRPAREASSDDVVVCTYGGLVYVKVLRRKAAKAWLLSANEKFKPILIDPSEEFAVHGVVVGRSGYALPGSTIPDPQ